MITGVSLSPIQKPPEMWPNLVSFLFYSLPFPFFLLLAQELLQKLKKLKGQNSTNTFTWALSKDLRKGQGDTQTYNYINLLWTGPLKDVVVFFMQNFLLENRNLKYSEKEKFSICGL